MTKRELLQLAATWASHVEAGWTFADRMCWLYVMQAIMEGLEP